MKSSPFAAFVLAAVLTCGCGNERKPVLPSVPAAPPLAVSPAPKVDAPQDVSPAHAPLPSPAAATTAAPAQATTTGVAPKSADAPSPDAAQVLPPDVLVQVNDRVLKLADAVKEVEILVASSKGSASLQELEQRRRNALKAVVEQFVANALLVEEADRLGIKLSPDDETNALARLQEMLPPGVTVEQAMSKSPLGEARFRSELINAARIRKLLSTVEIPDSEFVSFTNQYQAQIEMSDSARARHILIAAKPADDPAEREKKRQFAESLRTQLVAGADFAGLAKAHSDCESKNAGGDLGRFGRRKWVKPFADAAFSQPINAIGDVVETEYGYHVIQVTERTTIGRDDLLDIMRRQRMVERLAKSAKIKFNPPPQARPDRRPAARLKSAQRPSTNASEGVSDVNPAGAEK